MGIYYLDIETTGLNYFQDKIITIQFQQIDSEGYPIGELTILKEWESSEEDIVKQIHKLLIKGSKFDFIPVGFNFMFEINFLYDRFKKYNLPIEPFDFYVYDKPFIDIKPICVMINKMMFKGCGLDNITNKKQSGSIIPSLYENKEYDKIIDYIKDESESFMRFVQKCIKTLSTQEWKDNK